MTEDSTSSTGCSGNKLPELDVAHGRALPRPRPRHRADRAEQPGPLSSRPRPAPPASPSCGTGGQHDCARGGGSRGCRPSPRSQLKSESHLSTPPPLTKQVTWPVPPPPREGGKAYPPKTHPYRSVGSPGSPCPGKEVSVLPGALMWWTPVLLLPWPLPSLRNTFPSLPRNLPLASPAAWFRLELQGLLHTPAPRLQGLIQARHVARAEPTRALRLSAVLTTR